MLKHLTSPLISPRANIKKPLMPNTKLFKINANNKSRKLVRKSSNDEPQSIITISKDGSLTQRSNPVILKQSKSSNNLKVSKKKTKSLIKDLRIDSFNTADSLQKICFFSNNNNNNLSPTRSLSTSTSKKRFVSKYLKSVTKEEEIIYYENIDEAKKDFTENINLLENWINHIKVKGFQTNNKLLTDKQKIISKLESNIKCLEEKINFVKKNDHHALVAKGLTRNENDRMKEYYNKVAKDIGMYTDDIQKMKREISTYPLETQNYKMETVQFGEDFVKIQGEIYQINEKIQNYNYKISEVKKEKEKILSSITLINKSIFSLKQKIFDKVKNSCNFMLSVNNLVSNSNFFNNK